LWREITRVAAAEHGVFIAYAGLFGFEGGKGFTGSSRLVGPFGDLRVEAPFSGEAILRAAIDLEDVAVARAALPALGDLEANLPELVPALLNAPAQARSKRTPPALSKSELQKIGGNGERRKRAAAGARDGARGQSVSLPVRGHRSKAKRAAARVARRSGKRR